MGEYYFIYDYYLKGLNPDCYRYIAGALRDLKNCYYDERILEPEKYIKEFGLTDEQYKQLYEIVYWEYENINRYLLKHQRRPFFDTNNLKECIKLRDEFLKFTSEQECMEKYGVTNFNEYVPEEYTNDLITVIDIYTEDEFIKKALQQKRPPHVNLVAGLSHYNCYKFVNWMLLHNGLKPIFEDVEDEVKCDRKRKELLRLLPEIECLRYWDIRDKNDLDKYKIQALTFKIEKYVKCLGTDPSNTPWSYHLGCKMYSILDPNISVDDKKRYIREVNKINESVIFKDTEDVEESIKFLNEHLIYVVNDSK